MSGRLVPAMQRALAEWRPDLVIHGEQTVGVFESLKLSRRLHPIGNFKLIQLCLEFRRTSQLEELIHVLDVDVAGRDERSVFPMQRQFKGSGLLKK